jgi:hypothetical protein
VVVSPFTLETSTAIFRRSRYKRWRRLGPAGVCLLVLVVAGLGSVVASAGAAISTTIVGGTKAERAVLGQILAGLGSTRIPQLRVVPAVGGVNLQAQVEAIRPTWETLVVGDAFLERSAALGLPRLLEVKAGRAAWPTSNTGRARLPRATAASAAETRRTMLRLAAATGARLAELSITTPYALAVALRFQVNDAASFLHHRLASFVLGAQQHQSRYQGLYIEVDDAHGPAWASAETRLGGDSHVRPSLQGCDPFQPPTPRAQSQPAPTSRPEQTCSSKVAVLAPAPTAQRAQSRVTPAPPTQLVELDRPPRWPWRSGAVVVGHPPPAGDVVIGFSAGSKHSDVREAIASSRK